MISKIVLSNQSESTGGTGGKIWTTRSIGLGSQAKVTRYLNGYFLVGGYSGKLSISEDAITWYTQTNIGGLSGNINGLACSPTNKIYLCVDSASRSSRVANSATMLSTSAGFTKITASGENLTLAYGAGVFCRFINNLSTYYTSVDGLSWTTRTYTTTGNKIQVKYLNNMFIAGTADGDVIVSTNGISWTKVLTGFGSYGVYGICYNPDLNKYVIINIKSDSSIIVATSEDGYNWYTSIVNVTYKNGYITDLDYMNGVYLMTSSGGTLYRSTNLVEWSYISLGSNLSSITHSDDTIVVTDLGKTGVIYTSPTL